MDRKKSKIHGEYYGVLEITENKIETDQKLEELHELGFTILESQQTEIEINELSEKFDNILDQYYELYGKDDLVKVDEENTIRALFSFGKNEFLKIIFNKNLQHLLEKIFRGKFQLNQQNGIINPPKKRYNQSFWHRDLPYQHFISSRPLAINAIFCLDDFTNENGATFVLPGSHKTEPLPSKEYIQNHAQQVTAKSGSFIILNCMVFHTGGANETDRPRRAINHVFNIPYFKQQIRISESMISQALTDQERSILGLNFQESISINDYLMRRSRK